MNLEQLGKRDQLLKGLLQQAQQWQRLDAQVKKLLPANLRAHFQTACVQEGRLVLLAANNMAASRLKMITPVLLPQLQALREDIKEVGVRVVPKTPAPPKTNSLKLSEAALSSFAQTAEDLGGRHPQLAEALAKLVAKHRSQG